MEQLFQEFLQVHVIVEGFRAGLELDEEVEVAPFRGLSSGLGAKEAKPAGAEPLDKVPVSAPVWRIVSLCWLTFASVEDDARSRAP